MRLESKDSRPWVWYSRFDKRNGYWAWGPVGGPFNRRRPLHWAVALLDLWRKGER